MSFHLHLPTHCIFCHIRYSAVEPGAAVACGKREEAYMRRMCFYRTVFACCPGGKEGGRRAAEYLLGETGRWSYVDWLGLAWALFGGIGFT